MQELSSRMSRLASSRRGIALGLAGPPGIGKTYTAMQVLRALPFRWVSLEASTPQTLLSQLPKPPQLPAWVEPALQTQSHKQALALATWLGALAPFALHLENLHEALPEHLALWQQLAEQVRKGRSVGLLATSRTALPEPFETLWLSPLSREQVGQLLEEKAKATLPTPALDWIHAKAAGNSLFSLEYFRYLARKGNLFSDGERWRWQKPQAGGLPASVEAVIAEVLQGQNLSATARRVLEVWAILSSLGKPEPELWAKVAGVRDQELEGALGELEHVGVRQNHTWTHPLYAEVARMRLSRESRRALAREALEALQDQPEVAAELILEAGLEPAEISQRLQQAAEQLLAQGKLGQAGRLLAQATDYAQAIQQPLLALKAAELLEHHHPAQALELAERAWRLKSGDEQVSHLYARLLAASGQFARAESILQTLAGSTRPQRIELAAQAQEFEKVIELFEAEPTELTPYPQSRVYMALLHLGRLEQAHKLIEQSLNKHTLDPLGKTFLLGNLADLHALRGEIAEAALVQSERIGLLRDLARPRDLARGLAAQAEVLEMLGQMQHCKDHLEEAASLYADLGDGSGYAWARSRLGALLADMGPFEEAEEVLLSTLGDLELSGNLQHLAAAHINLAYLYLNWGKTPSSGLAIRHASEAVRWARECQSTVVESQALAILAWAEVVKGQAQRGHSKAQEGLALAKATRYGFGDALGRFASGLARVHLGERDAGLSDIGQAVEALHQMGLEAIAERLSLEQDRLTHNLAKASVRLEFFRQRSLNGLVKVSQRYFPELGPKPSDIAPPPALYRMEILGLFRLLHAGKPITLGEQANRLLIFLLMARLGGHSEVLLPELLEFLYPNRSELEAKNALHQLVHRLRGSLDAQVIQRTPQGYVLDNVGSDAEDFLRDGDTRLWRGVLLQDQEIFAQGIAQARLYDRLLAAALDLLPSNPEEAARIGRILLTHEPYNQTLLALTLTALRDTNQLQMLDQVYTEAVRQAEEMDEALPATPEEFLQHSGT